MKDGESARKESRMPEPVHATATTASGQAWDFCVTLSHSLPQHETSRILLKPSLFSHPRFGESRFP